MTPAPLRGSLPTAKWMLRSGLCPLATHEHLASMFREFPWRGVSLALGPEPGVVDFEIDDPAFALDLPATLRWR